MLRRMFANGAWYYTVTIASFGTFAWVPFVHAATRLRLSANVRRGALLYGACAIALLVVAGVTPTDRLGNPEGTTGDVLSTIVGIGAIVVMAVACIQLRPLRRAVYGLAEPDPLAPGVDPAVAKALASRERRENARALVERDPNLARDLNIGRPDRPGDFDDGGLVDINGASPDVLVQALGMERGSAERLAATRETFASGFTSINEVLAYVDVSERDADVLRDRGIVLRS